MNKRILAAAISSVIILLGIVGISNNAQFSNVTSSTVANSSSTTENIKKIAKPTCDGTVVTSNCVVDDIKYASYIYHAAVAEKSHTETVTTYTKQISSYCTLCNDDTYSPSCATGRGACSHHGGVGEWNAPRYKNVPEYSTKTVVDAPAVDAYYEKVTE